MRLPNLSRIAPVAAKAFNSCTGSHLAMTKKTPAYGARAAKAPLAPMTIERRDPRPSDVVIEILYCGICHSDVHKVNDDRCTSPHLGFIAPPLGNLRERDDCGLGMDFVN